MQIIRSSSILLIILIIQLCRAQDSTDQAGSWIATTRRKALIARAATPNFAVQDQLTEALHSLRDARFLLHPDEALSRSEGLVDLTQELLTATNSVALSALELQLRILTELKRLDKATILVESFGRLAAADVRFSSDLGLLLGEDYAVLSLRKGEPEQALRALEILARAPALATNRELQIRYLSLKGEAYLDLADRNPSAEQQAKELLNDAFEALIEAKDVNSVLGSVVLHNSARYYVYSLESRNAIRYCWLAFTNRLALLHPLHPDLASTKVLLSGCLVSEGRIDEARTLLAEAFPVLMERCGPSSYETLLCLQYQAINAQLAGRPVEASTIAARLLRHQRQLALEVLTYGDEADCRYQLRHAQPYLVPGLLPSIGDPLFAESLLRFKGALARSQIEKRQLELVKSNSPAMRLSVEWKEKLNQFIVLRRNQFVEPEDKLAADQLDQELTEMEWNLAQLGVRLGATRQLFGSSERPDLKIASDTAILDYIAHTIVKSTGEMVTQVDVLVHLAGKVARRIRVTDDRTLPDLVEQYRQVVLSHNSSDDKLVGITRKIREIVWDPVQQYLPPEVKNIIVCPDGTLSFVSFAGLAIDDHLLGERFSFRYVTSVGDLVLTSKRRPGKKSMSLFVDPAFDLKPKAGRTNTKNWTRIPHTVTEGKAIHELAEQRKWKVDMYSQEDVTKEKLHGLDSPGILLVATHGYWSPTKSPENTFARDAKASLPAMEGSGLVLSGGNWTVPAPTAPRTLFSSRVLGYLFLSNPEVPNEDGYLSASEVAQLDLRDTWLVVLSACNTGLGELGDTDGVYGLQRGVLAAGARNVLLTAWPVRDSVSARFVPEVIAEAIDSNDLARAFGSVQSRTMRRLRQENQMRLGEVIRLAGPYLLLTSEL